MPRKKTTVSKNPSYVVFDYEKSTYHIDPDLKKV